MALVRPDDAPINIEGATFMGDGGLLLGLCFPTTADGHPLQAAARQSSSSCSTSSPAGETHAGTDTSMKKAASTATTRRRAMTPIVRRQRRGRGHDRSEEHRYRVGGERTPRPNPARNAGGQVADPQHADGFAVDRHPGRPPAPYQG